MCSARKVEGVLAGICMLALQAFAASGAQNVPTGTSKAAGGPAEDLIGRPVDLDLSKGVQAPYRDTSKLPSTFAEAAKTQPIDPKWGTDPYRPKSPRDFTGIWISQGGIGWTPGVPTAACLPPGMPRIMTMTYPMEITMGPDRVMIYAEWDEQIRRIFTDARPLPEDPDPTYNGESVGHWEGNFLLTTTYGLRADTNLESSGLPKSDEAISYERIWLADDNTLRDEVTLVDPVALAKPWTVTKQYKRAPADFKLMPYVCLENNRNPVDADGSIQVILQSGGKAQN